MQEVVDELKAVKAEFSSIRGQELEQLSQIIGEVRRINTKLCFFVRVVVLFALFAAVMFMLPVINLYNVVVE